MTTSGISEVLSMMHGRGINESNVIVFMDTAKEEHRTGALDDENYLLKTASILSNSNTVVDSKRLVAIFDPWDGHLESVGNKHAFWLLLEQLSYHVDPHTAHDFMAWLEVAMGNAVTFAPPKADGQLLLILRNRWFPTNITDRIALWILYLRGLGRISLRQVSDDLVKEALNYTAPKLGRDSLLAEIRAYEENQRQR